MSTALLSVSDKRGIVTFARALARRGWRLVSTGGTARELDEAGVPVESVAALTGFPEILSGRVKTLHPAVHAGILARRSVPEDVRQLEKMEIGTIDLVAVNLYPFRKTVARPDVTLADALEQIDVGGPTLLRAAAKNYAFVWPVCDPADYERVLEALEDEQSDELRRALAAKVFLHTAGYDAAISGYLERPSGRRPDVGPSALPEELLGSLVRVEQLRYGENPDQIAGFYRHAAGEPWGIPAMEQLHGKKLSYNNLLDVDAALGAIGAFSGGERAACAIIKHTTPCGLAVGRSLLEAYERALACDPLSAFGAIIAFNQPVTETVAEAVAARFVECVVAPGYASEALRILQRKKNLRILEACGPERPREAVGHLWPGVEARGVRGGLLLQSAPRPARELVRREEVRVPTSRAPSEEEWDALSFAWTVVQSVKSNAILLARGGATIGIGAGQMSRVDAVRLAVWKAGQADHATEGSVLASDAFFPFRDGIDAAAEAGVRAVVQPGGSIRDAEVVEAADEHEIAMVLTGRRLFRH